MTKQDDLATVDGTIKQLRDWRKDMPSNWYGNETIDAAVLHLESLLNATVSVDVLTAQLDHVADKDCRLCDGKGVFYGNVAICGCVMEKIPESKEATHGE